MAASDITFLFLPYSNSLTLDATHEHSDGGGTVTTVSGIFDATTVKVGSWARDYPTNNDSDYIASAGIWDNGASYENIIAGWFYIETWTSGNVMLDAVEVAAANNHFRLSQSGTSGSGNLDLNIRTVAGGQTTVSLTGNNIALSTWYYVKAMVDRANTTIRIELYAATDLVTPLDSVQNTGVTASHFPSTVDRIQWGGQGTNNSHYNSIIVSNRYAEPVEDFANITSWTQYGASAALTGTVTASIVEADIVAGGKTIILTLTGDTWAAAGTGPIGSTADTQAIIDGIDSAQAEATGWDAVVKVGIDIADVVRTSNTVCTITLDAEATYNITAQEVITATIPAAALVTSVSAVVATPTFTVDIDPAPTIVSVDTPVFDGETGNSIITTGYASAINDITIETAPGVNETDVSASIGGSAGNWTFDMPDFSAITVDTAGVPMSTASWPLTITAGDGIGSDTEVFVFDPKAGWYVIEAVSPTKNPGSVFEDFVGIPVNTDQVLYESANNSNNLLSNYFEIQADGTILTNLLTGTVSCVYRDSSDGTYKPFSVIISESGLGLIFITGLSNQANNRLQSSLTTGLTESNK